MCSSACMVPRTTTPEPGLGRSPEPEPEVIDLCTEEVIDLCTEDEDSGEDEETQSQSPSDEETQSQSPSVCSDQDDFVDPFEIIHNLNQRDYQKLLKMMHIVEVITIDSEDEDEDEVEVIEDIIVIDD